MNALLAYLVYFVVIAVPAGLFCVGVIYLIRRFQVNLKPAFTETPVMYHEVAVPFGDVIERYTNDEVEKRVEHRLKKAGTTPAHPD
jgi:hypothetical protein